MTKSKSQLLQEAIDGLAHQRGRFNVVLAGAMTIDDGANAFPEASRCAGVGHVLFTKAVCHGVALDKIIPVLGTKRLFSILRRA